MKDLSKSQKKIILISSILFLAFLIFVLFIYLPARNKVSRLKAELISAENQIRDIEALIKEAKTLDEGIMLLRKKCQELNEKFPHIEEDCFKALSELAKKTNIEITAFNPEPKKPILDDEGKGLVLEGKTCQSIVVSMEMKCYYKDLVQYLQALKESFPALVTISRMRITKEAIGKALNVTLELNLFLLT